MWRTASYHSVKPVAFFLTVQLPVEVQYQMDAHPHFFSQRGEFVKSSVTVESNLTG